MSIRRRTMLAAIVAAFLSSPLWSVEAVAGAGVQGYASALVEYFNSLRTGLEPFIVAEGQEVGDLIDVKTLAVLKRRSACFPNLPAPQPRSYDLPRFVGMSEVAASFLFDVKKLFGLSANQKLVDSVSLVFSDATIEDVTLDELQSSLSKECEFLRPLIMDGQTVTLFARNVTLIRTIVRSKSNTVMSFGADANIGAKIEELKTLLPGGAASVLPIDASIEAKLAQKAQKSVMLQTEGPSAVAFRPTHIPKRFLGGAPAEGLIPFDPEDEVQIEIQQEVLNAWVKDLK